MAATTIKIEYLQGSRFVTKEVESNTVGQLRSELDIPSGAEIAVNREDKTDSYELQDGDQVAAVVEDKTGGERI